MLVIYFCFHVGNPLMPILPILCVSENPVLLRLRQIYLDTFLVMKRYPVRSSEKSDWSRNSCVIIVLCEGFFFSQKILTELYNMKRKFMETAMKEL